jgi:hypothetical protein
MALSVETLWQRTDVELLAAYYEARRAFAEMKFARDSQRARLEWQRAKAFLAAGGRGVSDRNNVVDASEELGRKGQEIRELTRDLDLIRADVDLLAMIIRLRGAPLPSEGALAVKGVGVSDSGRNDDDDA